MIISNQVSNELDLDFIVVPMTRTVRREAFPLTILPSEVSGDLPVASELRCNKPFTLRRQLIFDKIGTLNREMTMQTIQPVVAAIRVMHTTNV